MNLYNDIRLVGLVGKAGSGKDTLADQMATDGWEKVAFADALKHMCMDYLGLSHDDAYTQEGKMRMNADWGMTNRAILQKVGTEAMRDGFDKDVWVKILMIRVRKMLSEGRKVVITDCRFDNEAQMVEDMGGIVVEVVRDSQSQNLSATEQQHVSEKPVDRKYVAFTIDNNRSVSALRNLFGSEMRLFSLRCGKVAYALRLGEERGLIDGGVASQCLLECRKRLEIEPETAFAVDGRLRLEWNGLGASRFIEMDGVSVTDGDVKFGYGDIAKWSDVLESIRKSCGLHQERGNVQA